VNGTVYQPNLADVPLFKNLLTHLLIVFVNTSLRLSFCSIQCLLNLHHVVEGALSDAGVPPLICLSPALI